MCDPETSSSDMWSKLALAGKEDRDKKQEAHAVADGAQAPRGRPATGRGTGSAEVLAYLPPAFTGAWSGPLNWVPWVPKAHRPACRPFASAAAVRSRNRMANNITPVP